jgi:gamma-glutamyltranspeptidase/glutathione hydrolase
MSNSNEPSNEQTRSTPISFDSRRSPIYCSSAAICSSQPLASAAGMKILEQGGNAVDAAIAMAAALNVTEPMSTG